MKTTVYLDDDLACDLKELAHESGQSFRAVLNKALRRGVSQGPARKPARYKCPKFSLGKPLVNLDKATALAAELDDAETIIKLMGSK